METGPERQRLTVRSGLVKQWFPERSGWRGGREQGGEWGRGCWGATGDCELGRGQVTTQCRKSRKGHGKGGWGGAGLKGETGEMVQEWGQEDGGAD